jgi:hydrogenase maturation protease
LNAPRILVAGIGNIFFHDDAFGVEVVQRISQADFPPTVKVEDFGIRGMHLAFEIASGYDVVIFVDAVRRGEAPGTVYIAELNSAQSGTLPDAHSMELVSVLAFVEALGGSKAKYLLVGCEVADADEGIGLSRSVATAVTVAATHVENLVRKHAKRIAGIPARSEVLQ